MGRFVRLAGLGARTSASLLFGKSGESAAERAAEVLGTLRGVAAKVGQMASYVDGIVPEGQREAYELALRRLRDQAPTTTPAEIRALVELELGAPISQLFRDWEDEPVASASIGQVHRARLADGRVVAVKVQHSGIAQAVESDLENVGMLESVIGTVRRQRRQLARYLERDQDALPRRAGLSLGGSPAKRVRPNLSRATRRFSCPR